MALGVFMQDTSLGSWADEMEDVPMPSAPSGRPSYGGERSTTSGGYSSTGGFAERAGYSVREQLPLPTKPPYTVHLGNMSFDATEGDIQDFFSGCSVTSVRIVEDKLERKPKGFGYAEFATLEGLKKALEFNNTQFQGRNIRVSVAEPQKDRPDAREFGDWTRKGPLPDIGGQRRVSDRVGYSSGPRGFDAVSEGGSDRNSRRPPYEQGDGKVRDFGNWDRKGPLTPTIPNGPMARNLDRPVSHDGPRDRRNSPAWGEGRSQDGSRPPRREFVERPVIDRAPTAPEMDNQWRAKMRPDPPAAPVVAPAKSPALSSREISAPPSPAGAPQPLSVRPKLNLTKRTLTEADSSATSTSSIETKPSPFGGARPIDTAAREKEVEEKRQIALREKKEAEEKKRLADEKTREEKRLAKEAEKAESLDKDNISRKKNNGPVVEKENGSGAPPPPPGKNYEILRRTLVDDSSAADGETEGKGANGIVVDDKAVKPKEIVRDVTVTNDENGITNGNTSSQTNSTPDVSAKTLEDDGWSTVSKPRNNRRNGNQAARAIAS